MAWRGRAIPLSSTFGYKTPAESVVMLLGAIARLSGLTFVNAAVFLAVRNLDGHSTVPRCVNSAQALPIMARLSFNVRSWPLAALRFLDFLMI